MLRECGFGKEDGLNENFESQREGRNLWQIDIIADKNCVLTIINYKNCYELLLRES